MHILLSAHTVYPHFIGGRERHVHGLARGLARRHRVTVLGGASPGNHGRRKIHGYTLVTLPMISVKASSVPLQIYRIIPGFTRALRRLDPDLVHAFEYGSFTTDLAAVYCAREGIPLLLTVYGYQFQSKLLKASKRIYDRTFGRWLLRRAARVFYPSDQQRQELQAVVGRRLLDEVGPRLTWQPNSFLPLDAPDQRSLDEVIRRCRLDGAFVLLAVARLLPRKGLDILLDALHRLVAHGALGRVRLLVVGPDCGSRRSLERLTALYGLARHVTFVGEVPYAEVSRYFYCCDLFVLPSHYEGLPLALLEAMSCGKPALFSDLPCAQRVLSNGHDVHLVEPGNVAALARAISDMATDPAYCSRLGARARRTARTLQSSVEVRALERFYAQVLGTDDDLVPGRVEEGLQDWPTQPDRRGSADVR